MKVNFKIFLFGLLLFLGHFINAQSVDINLSENNIINRVEYNEALNSGNLIKTNKGWRSAGGEWYLMLKSNSGTFVNGASSFNSDKIKFKLNNIDGRTPGASNLPGVWPDYKDITTGFQSFYQPEKSNSPVSNGSIQINYLFNSSNYAGLALLEGS